ncbi:MAG: ATP-binding protein, partial [Egibacteraceae bacterium]
YSVHNRRKGRSVDPIRNPYTPGAGAPPPVLAGRDEELAEFDVLLGRLSLGRPERPLCVTGLRGVGKTVLLRRFEGLARRAGWRATFIEASEQEFELSLARGLRSVLLAMDPGTRGRAAMQTALGVLRAFTLRLPGGAGIRIEAQPVRGRADAGDPASDLPELFDAVADAAAGSGGGLLVLVDEAQILSGPQLAGLVTGLHQLAQRPQTVPISAALGGLPPLRSRVAAARTYAERLFNYRPIDRLDDVAARAALVEPALQEGVWWDDDAVLRTIAVSDGYPFFLQQYAQHAWDHARAEDRIDLAAVQAAEQSAGAALDNGFFAARLGRASDAELGYLAALAYLGPGTWRSTAVATAMGRSAQQVSALRERLIAKGLLYAPRRGEVAFTVPGCDDYLRRTQPPPPARQS